MNLDAKEPEVGGSESARTEHPNREVVSSRQCLCARNVIHVESGIEWGSGPLPFSLLPGTISLFPSGFINLALVGLSESVWIWMNLREVG